MFVNNQPVTACLVLYQPVSYYTSLSRTVPSCTSPFSFTTFIYLQLFSFYAPMIPIIIQCSTLNSALLALTTTLLSNFTAFNFFKLLENLLNFITVNVDNFSYINMSSFLRVDLRIDSLRKSLHPDRLVDHAQRHSGLAKMTYTLADWTHHQPSNALFRHPAVKRFL